MFTSLSWFWDFVWFEPMQVLWILSQSLWVHVFISPMASGKMLLPWSHRPPLTPVVFPAYLLHRFLSLERKGLIKTTDLGLRAPKSLTLCKFFWLCISVLNAIYYKKLLWWGFSTFLICGYSNISLRGILLLWFFGIDPWPLDHCHVWAISHGVSLKYNQKVVGYSLNICATISPTCFTVRVSVVDNRICSWVILIVTFLL